MGSNLPQVYEGPPDTLQAETVADAIAVSGWSGGRTIAIGNEAKEEWLIFGDEAIEVANQR